jgi:hypothetical protein
MSDCCSSCATEKLNRHTCPINGNEYKAVSIKTIQHHIKQPWNWTGTDQDYYFCDDPDCDVVYFGENNTAILTTDLRTTVGLKVKTKQATLCYCFGVSYEDAEKDKSIKDFVTHQTKSRLCECETKNPSGKCCLKDFPMY